MPTARQREQLIHDIATLRGIEDGGAGPDVAQVRAHLEDLVGRTVPRASAARTLGVSQTALDRWIAAGDVPAVMTPAGRHEVPLALLIELLLAVRRTPGARPLARVLHERRARADRLDGAHLLSREELARASEPHGGADLRGLAYHRAVAARLDARLIGRARELLDRWRREGKIAPSPAEAWEALLDQPVDRIAAAIGEDSAAGRRLRQTSPFAGALTEPERRRVLALVAGAA